MGHKVKSTEKPTTLAEKRQSLALELFKSEIPRLAPRKITPDDEPYIREQIMNFQPIYVIAQDLGCHSDTLRKYVRENMRSVLIEAREAMKDLAESKMIHNIKSGNENAIEFFLDRCAKDRGYGEKLNIPASALPVINIGRLEVAGSPAAPKVEEQNKPIEIVPESVSKSPLEE